MTRTAEANTLKTEISPRLDRGGVVYQIYPMSFCDSNGDGIGDIPGIISKLDYIAALGASAIWLSPVYKSPNEDNGYDISDYRDINPQYGTLSDMDRLISEAKARGIGIVMDLVVNHTSREHAWFQMSRQRIEPYTDYYIWRDRPNNWTSFFAEDCWEFDDVRGQYYLHLFAKGQPDLNYHNPRVASEVEDILRFWLDRGVAGFRCDVVNILWKDSLDNGKKKLFLVGSENYLTRPGTLDLLRRFHDDVLAPAGAFTVGESVFSTPLDAQKLCDRRLDMIFSFEHMECDQVLVKWFKTRFRPKRLFDTLVKWQSGLDWNANYFDNHDQPRSVSRFGDGSPTSAKALATLLFGLRGTTFVYQGQELGMRNFDFRGMDALKDVESFNVDRLAKKLGFPKNLRWNLIRRTSRDNARTPMHWNSEKNAGFSSGNPWISVTGDYREINAAAETEDPGSVFFYYKKLIALREESDALRIGTFRPLEIGRRAMVFERASGTDAACVAVNLSKKSTRVKETGEVVLANFSAKDFDGTLPPFGAVIFKRT